MDEIAVKLRSIVKFDNKLNPNKSAGQKSRIGEERVRLSKQPEYLNLLRLIPATTNSNSGALAREARQRRTMGKKMK